MTPRRLLARVALALLAGLVLVGLERFGLLDGLQRGVLPARIDWNNDYQLVSFLRQRVVRDGLTRDRPDCLLFSLNGNDPPTAMRMRVLEKHSGDCPGARGTLPLLFTLQVDRVGQTVQSDSGSPGRFHPLP